MSQRDNQITHVYIPSDYLAQLDDIARRLMVSRSHVIRWAVSQYINGFFSDIRHSEVPTVTVDSKEATDALHIENPD